MFVQLSNETGVVREVKVGVSWTAFFFGGFPFFFRGMAIQGLAWIVLSILSLGISNLILIFLINKQTAIHYLENGYKPVGPNWNLAAAKWGLNIPEQDDLNKTLEQGQVDLQVPSNSSNVLNLTDVSPLPLIVFASVALFGSILGNGLLFAYQEGYLEQSFYITAAGTVGGVFTLLRIGAFSWVAIEYLRKTEHRAVVIGLYLVSYLIPFSHTIFVG